MSLTIIKAGILDTIQDTGRYGYQHSGINPGGAMDRFSAQLSNCLLGKEMSGPIIEMHFPASTIRFCKSTIICVAGADFSPMLNNKPIPLHQPVFVNKNAILHFGKVKSGVRCYLSILQDLHLKKWLGSFSTNIKAGAGGYEGRSFKTGDAIEFKEIALPDDCVTTEDCHVLPWRAEPFKNTLSDVIEAIEGPEWNWLSKESQHLFTDHFFTISNNADRMGYRLKGLKLTLNEQKELISSGVGFGTVQLLSNGQLIVLMADHQTTGGYPRVATVLSAYLPVLAQMRPNDQLKFRLTDIESAERKLIEQHQYLRSVQYASSFQIKNLVS
ncbi:MAG: biotin-dependent carboxyltransferase family protein [Segetibacter sp.]